MFALRSRQSRGESGDVSRFFGLSLSAAHFVLPRLLRKPVRMLSRFGRVGATPLPCAASMLTAAFLAASSLYGAYLGGHFPALVQDVIVRSGLTVDQIKILGNRETTEIDILEKLELDGWTSMVGFNPEEARERIVSLPWVCDSTVRKVYPDMIEVRIDECDAFAIWQHGSQLSILKKDGEVIAPFTSGRQVSLPLIIGLGAAERAADFVARVQAFPELASRVKGYIRVAKRRWDLRLDNGITIKLPESQVDAALADLVDLDRDNALLTRDISAVDMRFGDRLVVQLTPQAFERYAATHNTKPEVVKAKVKKRT